MDLGKYRQREVLGHAALIIGSILMLAAVDDSIASGDSVTTKVYECLRNGQRVFSDQPCAADAKQREINSSNRMSAREAAINYRGTGISGRAKLKQQRANDNDEVDSRQQRCLVLQGNKDNINSRMRAGYKNDEGERLRARLRKVDSEYYQLRCRDLN